MQRSRLFSLITIILSVIIIASIASKPHSRVQAQRLSATNSAQPNGKSLAGLLNADGSLNLSAGLNGSFDTSGYRMGYKENGAPIFLQRTEAAGDENWDGRFAKDLDSYVYAIAVKDGDIYVGGQFSKAGGVLVNGIAKWNGQSWSALGSGVSGSEPYWSVVFAIAVKDGDVYVGGQFSKAGGVVVNGIAKWNGRNWSALGSGVNKHDIDPVHFVTSIALGDNDDIYIGGVFTTAGGVAANRIAKWDGKTWSALGSGVSGSELYISVVTTIAVNGSDVYIGGEFTNVGGVAANRIAKWDGKAWSALGLGISGADFTVWVIAVSGRDVYVGGDFTNMDGIAANRIAKWDGKAWSALGSGIDGVVREITVSGSDVYVGGGFTNVDGVAANHIAKWDGKAWSALGSGIIGDSPPPHVAAIVVNSNDVYVGGVFYTAGGNPSNNFALYHIKAGLPPVANFDARTLKPNVGERVAFVDMSKGEKSTWSWDFDGDNVVDSRSQYSTFVYQEPGIYPACLTVSNSYGSSETFCKLISVMPVTSDPYIEDVDKQYPGFFLNGTNLTNLFKAKVQWAGLPGRMLVGINGSQVADVSATNDIVNHTFNMKNDFPAKFAPSVVTLTPINKAGKRGITRKINVYVFPYPKWLSLFYENDAFKFDINPPDKEKGREGEITFTLKPIDFPTPHIQPQKIQVPDFVPFAGGEWGYKETFATFTGNFSSNGTGHIKVTGTSGLQLITNQFEASPTIVIQGDGDLRFTAEKGLELTRATMNLSVDAPISKSVGLLDTVPQLQALKSNFVGKWVNKKLIVEGTLTPSMALTANFARKFPPPKEPPYLEFTDGKGSLSLGARLELKAVPVDYITATAWVDVEGGVTLKVPAPLFKEWKLTTKAGVETKVKWWSFDKDWKAEVYTQCIGKENEQSLTCTQGTGAPPTLEGLPAAEMHLIKPRFEKFGTQAKLVARPIQKVVSAAVPASAQEAILLTNTFDSAAPSLVPVGNGQFLLWEIQDTALPVQQSTNIAWSYFDGTTWTTPAPIAQDSRAEFAPVASVDKNGKVVAAWLRNKDTAFVTPINSSTDLPLFFKQLEVVTAVFDPVSKTWGTINTLTNDTAFDTNLRIVSDGNGRLLMTWLSNAGGEFYATADSPSTIKYALWDGTSWSQPATVATGLAGVSRLQLAARNDSAFIVLARDPDYTVDGDSVIDWYTWNGTAWTNRGVYASGGGDHAAPTIAYDALGEGRVVWLRGTDLVQATLSNPTPQLLRAGSGSLSFLDTRLIANPQGNLTLLRQEVASEGMANLYAMIFDPVAKTWSADRRLTENDSGTIHDLTAYYDNTQTLHAAYLSTQILRTSKTIMLNGAPVVFDNVPEDGQTDLHLFDHTLITDVAVTDQDLTLDVQNPAAGASVNAKIDVHNAGDFGVGAFNVRLYAGDPANGGTVLGTISVPAGLRAGDHQVVTIPFTYPATALNINAVLDADSAITEFSEANNRATIYLENTAPAARVVANVTSGVGPLTVEFDGTGSTDKEGDALTYNWVFADGTQSGVGAKVTHTFTQAGTYPVTLMVQDARGALQSVVVTINVITPSTAASVSGANYSTDLAAGAVVSVFGQKLALTTTSALSLPLPTELDATKVIIKDSTGVERLASLFFISPTQINYQIPPEVTLGQASVTVVSGETNLSIGTIQINAVAPGLFSITSDGAGYAAANVQRVRNGNSTFEDVVRYDSVLSKFVPIPIDLIAPDDVYLVLYGTGVRNRTDLANVQATIGGVPLPVVFAGAHCCFVGVDQVNVLLPSSLAGRGDVDVTIKADGKVTNTIKINIK